MSVYLPTPKLPYDILLEVMKAATYSDEDEDTVNLEVFRAFSLVSRTFVVLCQKRIFKRYNQGKLDDKRCYSILQQSPHLVNYVREICICLQGGPGGASSVSELDQKIFLLLASVEQLEVNSPFRNRKWSDLHLSIRRAVISLLGIPKITTLILQGVENPPCALLHKFCSIKNLDFRNANAALDFSGLEYNTEHQRDGHGNTYTDFGRLSVSSPRTRLEGSVAISLESLVLQDSDCVLLYMLLLPNRLSPAERTMDSDSEYSNSELPVVGPDPGYSTPKYHFSFNKLATLRTELTRNNLLPTFSLISEAQEALTTLDIRQRYVVGCKTDPFGFNLTLLPDVAPIILPERVSLEPLNNLRMLSLSILIQNYMPIHYNTLSSWYCLLRTAPPSIYTLHITLDTFHLIHTSKLADWFDGDDDDNDGESDSEPSQDDHGITSDSFLTGLDELLSNTTNFPSLRHVKVSVILPDNDQSLSSSEGGIDDDVTEDDLAMYRAALEESRMERATDNESANGEFQDSTESDDDFSDGLSAYDISDGVYAFDELEEYYRSIPLDKNSDSDVSFSQIEASVRNMLRMTRRRFSSDGSFSVNAEFGHHLRM